MLAIREMSAGELGLVKDIDMTESGTFVYAYADGALQKRSETWERPPRTPERWQQFIDGWLKEQADGGVAFGAFDGDTLVGIATLRPRLSETRAQLSALFISRPYRRSGVARRLLAEIVRQAREGGQRELYVSAVPSESAVGFYWSMGFRPTGDVDPVLFKLEPDDIHMVRPL